VYAFIDTMKYFWRLSIIVWNTWRVHDHSKQVYHTAHAWAWASTLCQLYDGQRLIHRCSFSAPRIDGHAHASVDQQLPAEVDLLYNMSLIIWRRGLARWCAMLCIALDVFEACPLAAACSVIVWRRLRTERGSGGI